MITIPREKGSITFLYFFRRAYRGMVCSMQYGVCSWEKSFLNLHTIYHIPYTSPLFIIPKFLTGLEVIFFKYLFITLYFFLVGRILVDEPPLTVWLCGFNSRPVHQDIDKLQFWLQHLSNVKGGVAYQGKAKQKGPRRRAFLFPQTLCMFLSFLPYTKYHIPIALLTKANRSVVV